ncbi:MAG TPA: hypothetical protein VN635_04540, partial [Conexibacter sp.]|nr:hypothetical protein [Conexibacter sp.]
MPSPVRPCPLALLFALLALVAVAPALASGPIAHIAAHGAQTVTPADSTALVAFLPSDPNPLPPGVQRPSVADLIAGHPEL